MNTIINFIRGIFKKKKVDDVINVPEQTKKIMHQVAPPDTNNATKIFSPLNSDKTTNNEILNITSENIGSYHTEITIKLNEEVFLKKIAEGTLGNGLGETRIEDLTGFYGRKQYSSDKSYCISYADGHYNNNKWKNGDIALIKDNKLLFKKKIQRPNDCFVSNNGIVICCDWLNSEALTGKFLIFDATGEEIYSKKTTANLGNCAISDNSEIALFETHNSETNDGDKIFIVDIFRKEIIHKFDRPFSFIDAKIDTDSRRVKLKNNKGFVYEIDFMGKQTNEYEYENQILSKGSLYDRLCLYVHRSEDVNLKDPKYLELLTQSLTDKDVIYSFGKDKIYRMIGDYYDANGNILKTIENWENALSLNPKVGVKRKLDTMKRQYKNF